MINRNNNYVSTNKSQIEELKRKGKKVFFTLAGTLLTASFLSGCGKINQVEEEEGFETVTIADDGALIFGEEISNIDLSSFNPDIEVVDIEVTNLTDVSELANYSNLNTIILDNNLVTDISALENIDSLERLSIVNNSVSEINLENFENLYQIRVEGNYSLYTDEFLDSIEKNNMITDITREDVSYVNEIRKIVESLDLEGKTDIQKEKIIYNYVLDNMKYDDKALKDEELAMEYNMNPLKYALEGKGVCANYAEFFEAMCEVAGINCYKISGKSDGEGHAWNLVEIDGEYLLCEPTWGDSSGIFKNIWLNKTGNSANKFKKEHDESLDIIFIDKSVSARSDMAVNSDINNLDVGDTAIDMLLEKVKTFSSKVDPKDIAKVVSIVLLGIGAGKVLTLAPQITKKLRKKIEDHKQEKIEKRERVKEARRKEREKRKLAKHNQIIKSDVMLDIDFEEDDELKVEFVPVKEEKEPTLEEKIISVPTTEERIEYLQKEADELLIETAEEQVDMEAYVDNKKLYDSERKLEIELAAVEIKSLVNKSLDERALERCHKKGYLTNINISDIENNIIGDNDRMILDITKDQYYYIDKKMTEYNRTMLILSELKLSQVAQEVNNINTDNFSYKTRGFIKVSILGILTLLLSIGFIILGLYLVV